MGKSTNLAVSDTADRPMEIFGLQPRSLSELYEVCERIASTDMVPKDMRGKPNNVLVAVQMGLEIGLAPMQALQNIAVINGRPSLWGDAIPAVAQPTGELEHWEEWYDEAKQTAYCSIRRRGLEEHVQSFSMADAQTAGLASKDGPWKQYPKRMCQMRARAFAFRDRFADALKGVHVAEEARDYIDMGDADVVGRSQPEAPKRRSEAPQEKPDDQQPVAADATETPAEPEKPKAGAKKGGKTGKAKAAQDNQSSSEEAGTDGPSADDLIKQIALAETRHAVLDIVGRLDHLDEDGHKRVADCGRSRWKELKAEKDNGEPTPAEGAQQGFDLPEDYGEEK